MADSCQQCQKTFSTNSNLHRHLREVHGGGNVSRKRKDGFSKQEVHCVLCDRTFKRKDHLQKHMDAVHSCGVIKQCNFCTYSNVNKYALIRHLQHVHKDEYQSIRTIDNKEHSYFRPSAGPAVTIKQYPCSKCNHQYKFKKHLNFHLKKAHGQIKTVPLIEKECPLCPFTANNKSGGNVYNHMYSHFYEVHDTPMETISLLFSSISEFDAWKLNIERETVAKFIRKNRHAQRTISYGCHRSGKFKSKGTGRRSLKVMGSAKINGFCPASITANIRDDGEVYVKFLKTHVGHRKELKHISLTPQEREYIANQLAGKTPHREILRKIKSSVSNSQLRRIHLTTHKDILNIERSFNLADKAVKHPFSPVSVDIWVDTFKNSKKNILTKRFKGKTVSKLKILRRRHGESLKLATENVLPQHPGEWLVLSNTTSKFYAVNKINPSVCNDCSLQCHHCNSCFHQYQCSCIDSEVNNNMCKHIHLVAKLVRNEKPDGMVTNEGEPVLEAVAFEQSIICVVRQESVNSEDFMEAKKLFIAELMQTLENDITNVEELKAAQNHCKTIKPMLESMKLFQTENLQSPLITEAH